MERRNSPEQEAVTEVKKLHLLIHPGFLLDYVYTPEALTKKYETLLDRYKEQATGMRHDEIMIALLHPTSDELLQDFRQKRTYTQKLSAIKKVLGPRMIALSGDYDIEDVDTFSFASEIARKRGYAIPEDVPSEAYGETLGMCVSLGAQTANISLVLRQKTLVRPRLTDYPDIPRERKLVLMKQFDRLEFALRTA